MREPSSRSPTRRGSSRRRRSCAGRLASGDPIFPPETEPTPETVRIRCAPGTRRSREVLTIGMNRIRAARFKPGKTAADLPPATASAEPGRAASSRLIRGRALIFWDEQRPGRKRDAIDTDQITPASDCVSESLETLDERWKAGAFRHLMPDFRERVHRGETFLIAGERFAIGSSREMSPAGLKGVAEEKGLELVVVCSHGMGDIFRRNALNLGLQVVQSPEAVEDARDGDVFSFDPATRRLTNETRGRSYEPVPLSAKEEEIRRGGGIFAVGRRELRRSVESTPEIRWPDPE